MACHLVIVGPVIIVKVFLVISGTSWTYISVAYKQCVYLIKLWV